MTQTQRTRTRSEKPKVGYFTEWNADGSIRKNTSHTSHELYEDCIDMVAKPRQPGLPFYLQRNVIQGGRCNKSKSGGDQCIDFLPTYVRNGKQASLRTHLVPSNRPTDASLVTDLLRRTNPESVELNLPLFLFELRELPTLIRDVGFYILKRRKAPSIGTFAGHQLMFQFGIFPFLSDLKSMFSLMDNVNKRFHQLNELGEKGGKVYTRKLWAGGRTATDASSTTVESVDYSLYGRFRRSSYIDISGCSSWVPDVKFPTSSRERWKQSWNHTFGLNLRPAEIWDAMPWSWFIDYFTNIGDFIEAQQGNYQTKLSWYALMETGKTTLSCDWSSKPAGMTASTYYNYYTSKRRWTPPIAISTKFDKPILSSYQTYILGSLLTTRLFK